MLTEGISFYIYTEEQINKAKRFKNNSDMD